MRLSSQELEISLKAGRAGSHVSPCFALRSIQSMAHACLAKNFPRLMIGSNRFRLSSLCAVLKATDSASTSWMSLDCVTSRLTRWMESPNRVQEPKHNKKCPAMILQCSYGACVATFSRATTIRVVKGFACWRGLFNAKQARAAPRTLEDKISSKL